MKSTEAHLAMAFIGASRGRSNTENRFRNLENARKALAQIKRYRETRLPRSE